MNHNIVILGHHNFGLSILLETIVASQVDPKITIVSNLDSSENKLSEYPYLPGRKLNISHTTKESFVPHLDDLFLLSTISPTSRNSLYTEFHKTGITIERYMKLIHPKAYVSSTSDLSKGSYIGPMSTIAPHCTIGDFLFMNRNASIGHHCTIGDYVSIAPGSHISSQAEIGNNTWISPGVTVRDGIKIGNNCIIGLGSVVLHDIPDDSVAYGNPARVIRSNV